MLLVGPLPLHAHLPSVALQDAPLEAGHIFPARDKLGQWDVGRSGSVPALILQKHFSARRPLPSPWDTHVPGRPRMNGLLGCPARPTDSPTDLQTCERERRTVAEAPRLGLLGGEGGRPMTGLHNLTRPHLCPGPSRSALVSEPSAGWGPRAGERRRCASSQGVSGYRVLKGRNQGRGITCG